MLAQHASLLQGDPLLLQQHGQIPVSISTSQGVTNLAIPAGAMHLDMSQAQAHQATTITSQHQQDSNQISQIQAHHRGHHSQPNLVQVQVGTSFKLESIGLFTCVVVVGAR